MFFFKIIVTLNDGSVHRYESDNSHVTLYEIDRLHNGNIAELVVRQFHRDKNGVVEEIEYDDGA